MSVHTRARKKIEIVYTPSWGFFNNLNCYYNESHNILPSNQLFSDINLTGFGTRENLVIDSA